MTLVVYDIAMILVIYDINYDVSDINYDICNIYHISYDMICIWYK